MFGTPATKKPDLNLLPRFAAIAIPYWRSEEKRTAWTLSLLLALLLVGDTTANVLFNTRTGELTSALAARDTARFWHSIWLFCGLLAFAVPVYSWYYYVRDKLGIEWRRWLTHQVLDRYFAGHAFYNILKSPEIDNPDQRIAEDVATFTQQSLNIALLFGSAAFQLLAFSRVLWSISRFARPLCHSLRRRRHPRHPHRVRTQNDGPLLRAPQTQSRFPLRPHPHP